MCLPIIAAAVAVAGSIASSLQARAAAAAQTTLTNQVSARNQAIANQTAINQYAGIAQKTVENEQRLGDTQRRVQTEATQARSRAAAAAAESGVGGASVDALFNDFSRQEGNYLDTIATNKQNFNIQANADRAGVQLGLNSRLVSSTPDYIQGPSLIAGLLGGWSNGLNAYSAGQNIENNAQRNAGNT